jgi:hypothetical protein
MRSHVSTLLRQVAPLRSFLALLTILAIVGTLSACGRYGSPKRPSAKPAEAGFGISVSLLKR